LHLESEVFFQVFDDHDEEGQFDAESLLGISGASDVVGAHVRAHDFQHARLNVLVSDTLDVPIAHFFVPDLQWLAPNAVEDGQETRLKRVLEHS